MNGFDSWFPKMLQSARIDLRDAKTEKEQKRYRKAIAIMQEESYTVPISVLKAALKAQDRQTAAIQTAIHNAIREYEARYETAKKQGLVE